MQDESAGPIPAFEDVLARAAERARTASMVRRPLAMRLAPFVGVLALAAALLLFVRTRPVATGVQSKGDAHVGFYVKRGEHVWRGSDGERVQPGDALRFTVTSATASYVAVMSVDGAHHASVYYPYNGVRAVPCEAGADIALPSSVVLDSVVGEEMLIALSCDRAVELESIRARLEGQQFVVTPAVEGCTVETTRLEKDAGRSTP
jgi:hypothetical protein